MHAYSATNKLLSAPGAYMYRESENRVAYHQLLVPVVCGYPLYRVARFSENRYLEKL